MRLSPTTALRSWIRFSIESFLGGSDQICSCEENLKAPVLKPRIQLMLSRGISLLVHFLADTLLEPISGAGAILVGGRGEIPVGLHWRPGGQAARAQGRVMGACFGSSSVCTEQYNVWAPLWGLRHCGTLAVRPCLGASWSPPSSQPDRHQIHLLGTGKQV